MPFGMTRRVVYTIFEGELLLSILEGEIDLGTVCMNDGFCGAQERSAQDNGCPCIDTYFQNHKVYGYVWWLSHSNNGFFKNSLGVAEWLIYKLQTHVCVQQSIFINFIMNYLWLDVDACSEVTDNFLENVRSNGDGDDRSSCMTLLFRQGIIYPPSHRWLHVVVSYIVNIDKIWSF